MITIQTTFNQLYLSAELPEEVVISTNLAAVNVTVYYFHAVCFTTTLYPYSGKATLRDIRSIIEQVIREEGYSCGQFEVYVTGGSENASSGDFNVVYSDIIQQYSADTFCSGYFLTTRTSFRISSSGVQRLSLFAKAGETYTGYTDCVVLPAGSSTPVILRLTDTVQRTANMQAAVDYFDIEADLIQDAVYDNYPEQAGKLMAFTVHRGNRAMTFFVTDEEPDKNFSFLNAFDCLEYAEIYGVTTAKQKVERSEAVCGRRHLFYDKETTQSFEVETAALTYEEAVWLQQMLSSRKVIVEGLPGTNVEVLITESNTEISDSDNEKNRIKFTWKLADNVQRQRITYKSMNFNSELS